MKVLGLVFLFSFISTCSMAQEVKNSNYIYGTVLQDSANGSEPLTGAVVTIRNDMINASVGEDGTFEFYIPDSLLHKTVKLECRFLGFQTYRKKIRLRRMPCEINIVMRESPVGL